MGGRLKAAACTPHLISTVNFFSFKISLIKVVPFLLFYGHIKELSMSNELVISRCRGRWTNTR